jgi:RNA polymerase sigma-70 factor, ECF subfamily
VKAADGSEDALRQVVIAEALNGLSRDHHEVLTETVMRRRTVNEAADILGLPVSIVKSRVYYALRALRILLEERGVTT